MFHPSKELVVGRRIPVSLRRRQSPRQQQQSHRTTFSNSLLSSADTSTCQSESHSLDQLIQQYAQLPQTSASLQTLLRVGAAAPLPSSGRLGRHLVRQRVQNQMASFLRNEIPIRLAHRIQDLQQVPYMRDMESVQAVQQIYVDSFEELLRVPPIQTTSEEEQFATILERLYLKHSSVLVQMAKGAYELRQVIRNGQQQEQDNDDDNDVLHLDPMHECQDLLDRFYTSRIGIRVLAGQYLALRQDFGDDYIGMICQHTSPYDIVRQASEHAKTMCRRQYGRAPVVDISGRLDLTFAYVPTYLHYIVLELLKVTRVYDLCATTSRQYESRNDKNLTSTISW